MNNLKKTTSTRRSSLYTMQDGYVLAWMESYFKNSCLEVQLWCNYHDVAWKRTAMKFGPTMCSHVCRQRNAATQFEANTYTCILHQARDNACEQVAIGFGFASRWSRFANQWENKSKTKANANYFQQSIENHLKTWSHFLLILFAMQIHPLTLNQIARPDQEAKTRFFQL